MLKTKYHGEIEINEAQILQFESGIPGFLDEKQFVVLPLEEGSHFLILQSITTSELAFVVTSPFTFFKEYEFNLDDNTAEKLKIEKPEDVQVMVILTLQDKFEDSTANLQAPIIVNEKNSLAKQVILNDPAYKTKHKLY
ncbi:flagellar assembly protein FliW [Metabacillus sp. GX 13764]|uniref:flagellar assembly protein FliW n=1 Tax=Metabacillus kandeliae TaxID=2900151 RepID=UPI001E44A54B|nr:flagellar assembly protein FliW [Metabacillus kandeliae]MCD7034446.1 flagellar assembly protein FliW [Metabacillus kandeliae]